jgi:hypothetical protein
MKNQKPGPSGFHACYGFGGAGYKFQLNASRAIVKEGKGRRYCRTCLSLLLEEVRAEAVKQLNKAGLK